MPDRRSSSEDDPLMKTRQWVRVTDEDFWVLCKVDRITASSSDGKTKEVHLMREHVPPRHAGQVMVPPKLIMSEADFNNPEKRKPAIGDDLDVPADDLVLIEDVAEYTMLHALRKRYASDVIYTAIGPVLVALNPYKPVACCAPDAIKELLKRELEELSPHILKVAVAAYQGLVDNGEAQSILVSGESGAGKTETAKLCMQALALASGSSGDVAERALDSGLLLEAFGNARTVYNNNSSRFGKWMQVAFSRDRGRIEGCAIRSYLLEQSRVAAPPNGAPARPPARPPARRD